MANKGYSDELIEVRIFVMIYMHLSEESYLEGATTTTYQSTAECSRNVDAPGHKATI